jgi:hypothetical protein
VNSVQEIDLGYRPHRFQVEIHEAMAKHRFSVVVTHRRFGKTTLAIATLVDGALRCALAAPRFGYVAPLLKQAKATAWNYLVSYATKIPGTKVREGELMVEFATGGRVTLYGGSEGNEEAMRGIYLDGVVIDEYAGVAPQMFDQVVLPTLADRRGWALIVGTPHGMDAFYKLYHELAPARGWYRATYRVDETIGIPQLSAEDIAGQQRNSTPLAWRQEWLADFAAEAEDAFIPIELISTAAARAYAWTDVSFAPVILGVDVARFGDDRSVIQRRQGLVAFEPIVISHMDNMTLAGRVAQEIQRHGAQSTFVDAGRGEGVIDRLRQLGFPVHEVNFGGKPIDEHYADKRTEMWAEVRSWLEQGGGIPNVSELKTDLAAPRYEFTASGKVRLESKDKIKARGMRSTDLGDSLALTFAMPVPVLGQRNRELEAEVSW